MGDYAEMILNGDACEVCGVPFLDSGGGGFPRSCTRCRADTVRPRQPATRSARCPGCARRFRDDFGLAAHRAMKAH
jgi:hypothetical protein